MGEGILHLLCVIAGTLIIAGAGLMYTLVPDVNDAVCSVIGWIGASLTITGLIRLWG